MTWQAIASRIVFYRPGDNWGNLPRSVSQFSMADEAAVLGLMAGLYNSSSTAAGYLESWAATYANLRIGQSVGEPGWSLSNGTLGYNLTEISTLYYFNTLGELVQEKPELTIIHEVIHTSGLADPFSGSSPSASDALWNTANFDHLGPTVAAQNVIAAQLGYSGNIQASYFATINHNSAHPDDRMALLTVGRSYTDGQAVNNVRLGLNSAGDTIDHALNTTKLADLLFGFGGADTIKAGAGDDYVYGGAGGDTIDGGDGKTSCTATIQANPRPALIRSAVAPAMIFSTGASAPMR
jgi:Ca2+-binding RTX toxin-like protein